MCNFTHQSVYKYTPFRKKVCIITHRSSAIWKPRCVTITHHWVCKITHLVFINDVLFYTPFRQKHTFADYKPFNPTHLSHHYTPFGYTHLSQFYTLFEYTHLSQFYTSFEDAHLSMLHTFRPKNSILHGNIFLRYIKSIKSVCLGVQPCRSVYGVHI